MAEPAARELGQVPPGRQGHMLGFMEAVKHSTAYNRIAAPRHTKQVTLLSSDKCGSRCGS
jgi:hypothetical protein